MKRIATLLIVWLLLLPLAWPKANDTDPQLRSDNVDEVLRAMTRKEKVRLLIGGGWGSLFAGFDIPFTHGIVPGAAGQTHAIPRLGIPSVVMADGPAGLRLRRDIRCTAFPVGTSLACMRDTALVSLVGEAMAEEALAYGVDIILSPGMNIMRHPLCGRNYEYYSEDPLLTAQTATAMVRGMQRRGIGACVKHFACNNQETNRTRNDAQVDEQTLRQLYLKPFELVVREAKPWTVMSSYNKLNGEYTQQSHWLLTDVLRHEWGYEGVVMTDWTGPRDTPAQVAAGNDLMMPGMWQQSRQLNRALGRGTLTEAQLDTCVRRMLVLVARVKAARAAHGSAPGTMLPEQASRHALVARRAAAAGMVVLENREQTLPLRLPGLRVGLYGTTSYEMIIGGLGSGHVNSRYVTSLPQGLRFAGAELDGELTAFYQRYLNSEGSHRPSQFYMSNYLGKAGPKEKRIKRSFIEQREPHTDVALITIGRQAGEFHDRKVEDDYLLNDIELDNLRLVSEVYHAQGKRVIVLLNVGGPIEVASWRHLADAIVVTWLPGQEAGNAVCDVLAGHRSSVGRLSMTWPLSLSDLPASSNFPSTSDSAKLVTRYREGMDVGHFYFDRTGLPVAYPFGWGLEVKR